MRGCCLGASFGELVGAAVYDPEHFPGWARELFGAMASGGRVNYKPIRHFNGGLFADDVTLELTREELRVLSEAARLDWGSVEPAVFGTLFERSLDPDKRGQLGAQYTGKDDILRVVEPVLMAPLRREWAQVRAEVEADATAEELPRDPGARTRAVNRIQREAQERLEAFAGRVRSTRVLDPGLRLGKLPLREPLAPLGPREGGVGVRGEVRAGALLPGGRATSGLRDREGSVRARARAGICVDRLPAMDEPERVRRPPDPVLGPMTNVLENDAILRSNGNDHVEPEWPEADVVVGNPPFLGGRRIRGVLGDHYFDALKEVYGWRISGSPDLVCYWFERARRLIEEAPEKGGAHRHAGHPQPR